MDLQVCVGSSGNQRRDHVLRAGQAEVSDGDGGCLVDVLVLHGLEPQAEVQRSLDQLHRLSPATEVIYLSADYGRLGDVGALVAAVRERVGGLDVLINNAGRPAGSAKELARNAQASRVDELLAPDVGSLSSAAPWTNTARHPP